ASAVLHYAQEIFEGLKAYRLADGTMALFRPYENARRFNASADRLAMPRLPEEAFVEAIRQLVTADRDWFPTVEGGSLYLRPFMIATEAFLGVRPAKQYKFLVIASPAGNYFKSGAPAVSIWVSQDYTRAAPGGTGAAKCAGNYAASLLAQQEAIAGGCDQVVFLDAVEKRWVEELGGMNVYFVFDDGTMATPPTSGSILEGITRDTIIRLAKEEKIEVHEGRCNREQLWLADEVFLTGTAAEVTPVREIDNRLIGPAGSEGIVGPVTKKLQARFFDIVRGSDNSHPEWLTKI
ncbi:MAG TPA: branched-chain amino acid aminotransferase, partial [Polyangiaceae bacterium]